MPGCTVAGVITVVQAHDTLERVGTALADPTRRRILVTLLAGPAYPADLAEALATGRTNISNHLACLRGCGLVRSERQGRQVRYELASPRLAHALADLVDLELSIERDHLDLDGRDD
jgi:DNA-binding transcriptional ArsR family regulator